MEISEQSLASEEPHLIQAALKDELERQSRKREKEEEERKLVTKRVQETKLTEQKRQAQL